MKSILSFILFIHICTTCFSQKITTIAGGANGEETKTNIGFLYSSLDSIKFGSGGGFTGLVSYYKVLPKSVYRGLDMIEETYPERTFVKRKKTKLLFKNVAKLARNMPEYDNPGNQYYFISIFFKEKVYRATWTSLDSSKPINLNSIERLVNQFVGNLKFVKYE